MSGKNSLERASSENNQRDETISALEFSFGATAGVISAGVLLIDKLMSVEKVDMATRGHMTYDTRSILGIIAIAGTGLAIDGARHLYSILDDEYKQQEK